MHTHPRATEILHRLLRATALGGAISTTLLGLVGCADTHWERAFYQGAAYGNEQCQLKRRPADAPCTELPNYESFERERARAKNASPPSSRVNPIEERQQ